MTFDLKAEIDKETEKRPPNHWAKSEGRECDLPN
jgi:hypothetical protein